MLRADHAPLFVLSEPGLDSRLKLEQPKLVATKLSTVGVAMTTTSHENVAYGNLVEELLEQITMGRSFEELFISIYDRLHGIIPYNRIAVALLDESGDTLNLISCRSDGPQALKVGYTAPIQGSTLHALLLTSQPRIINDLPDYLVKKPQSVSTMLIVKEGMRSNLTLPLVAGGKPIGVVFFSSRKKETYNEQHAHLLKRLAGHIAISIEKAQLIEALQKHNKELLEANELKDQFLQKLEKEVERRTEEITRLKAQVEQENFYLRDEIKTEHDFTNLIGAGRAMQECRKAIQQVANTNSTVLILGETGTGKELIARAIHELSPRKEHLLVKVNCAALAPGVITSELFGHEQGAFTGAMKRRLGRFELAQHGSIFLDEIAEVPLETQVLLLRVLQERVIERVGGTESIEVDVRVVAATNRDLKAAVDEGRFRADLFYRLNVFPIHVPPLRERREDIPALINHFISQFDRRMNKQVTRVNRKTMELLMNYHWPGNVRELENILERAMIVTPGDTLEIDPTWLSSTQKDSAGPERRLTMAGIERQGILQALERCGGKIYGPAGAAAALGLKPSTLYGRMRKHRVLKNPRTGSFA